MSTLATNSRASTNPALRLGTRLFNPLMLQFAGTRWLPSYGVLTHFGRRSGKRFRTPVVVLRTGDGFVVPLPWGEQTDWCRNVRAVGRCAIRWKGLDYQLAQPEVIDTAVVKKNFHLAERIFITVFGIDHCLRLGFRAASDEPA